MATTLRSISDLKTPNFAVMLLMTRRQLDAAERRYQLLAADDRRAMSTRIGARQWLSAIQTERTRRGGR